MLQHEFLTIRLPNIKNGKKAKNLRPKSSSNLSCSESIVVVEEHQDKSWRPSEEVAMVEAYRFDLSRGQVKLEGPHRASRVELD